MSFRYLYVVIVMLWMNICHVQLISAQQKSAEEVIEEAAQAMQSSAPIHLMMVHSWFDTHDSQTVSDQQSAVYLKRGKSLYSSMEGRTIIIEKDYMLMIYEDAKVVMLQSFDIDFHNQLSLFPTDSLMAHYESVTLKKETPEAYFIECRLRDPIYDRLVLEISKAPIALLKATLYFSDWEGAQPRLEITCDYPPIPDQGTIQRQYSIKHAVRNPGPNASLTAPYQSFEFHNQFAQP